MTANDIYTQFGTPKNLQQHMLSVTSLICEVREHWVGDVLNWDYLITAGLLHDLGNVIKFDFDKFPELLGDELPRIDFWRTEQKRLIEKYGNDDHEATGKMLNELGMDKTIVDVIQTKSFGNIKNTEARNNWLPKILQYCDLRVSPYGLTTLSERMKDIEERYEKYAGRPDFPQMVIAAQSIENQIQSHLDVSLSDVITNSNIAKYEEELRNYQLVLT